MRHWIAALVDASRRAKVVRETCRELYALSDHMLRDIGLRRDQIALIGQKNGPRIEMRQPARRLQGARHETDHRPYLARAHDPRQG
jgi:uncharacterized protein YjiS (DUF1127 family)